MTANANIQWKGTDVCMDITCSCGRQFHIDGFFAWAVKCPHCGQIYNVPFTLTITPVDVPQNGSYLQGESESET